MAKRYLGGIGLAIVVGLLVGAGCHKKTGEIGKTEKPRPKISIDEPAETSRPPAGRKGDEAAKAKAVRPEPPPPAAIPTVSLPGRLLDTCKVKVGDLIPEDEGKDLRGSDKSLRALLGKKLTVVLFWRAKNPYATQALADVAEDVAKPYAGQDVAIVTINVQDPPDEAARAIASAGGQGLVNLQDPSGKYFAKVATEKFPRIYLLDPAGKILWFDLQYSDSTRHDLLTAVRVALGEKK